MYRYYCRISRTGNQEYYKDIMMVITLKNRTNSRFASSSRPRSMLGRQIANYCSFDICFQSNFSYIFFYIMSRCCAACSRSTGFNLIYPHVIFTIWSVTTIVMKQDYSNYDLKQNSIMLERAYSNIALLSIVFKGNSLTSSYLLLFRHATNRKNIYFS